MTFTSSRVEPAHAEVIGASRTSLTHTVAAVVECKNGCGWTAASGYSTCCKSCCGESGPHARTCKRNNHRVGLKRRNQFRSKATLDQQEEAMKFAVSEAKNAVSGALMMDALSVFIEVEWLNGHEAVKGNIYRAVAFGSMSWPSRTSSVRTNVKFMGAALIWLIQIFGPLVMLVTLSSGGQSWSYMALGHLGTRFGDKLLSFLLIIAFQLNVIFFVESEGASHEQTNQLFTYLACRSKKNTSERVLQIGAATKCYLYVMSCFCTTLLLGQAESTKDVLFDALGILFLYNLDTISASDLNFVGEEDWPGHHLGWMHDRLSKDKEEDTSTSRGCGHLLFRTTYWIVIVQSVLMPLLFISTDFGDHSA